MDVGIGLPLTNDGVEGVGLLAWARRAEARGFSSLGTLDRLVYRNFEPLVSLAAVAAVTERIRLATAILIAPYRANAALVAKQAATLDRLSNGRLVLGVAVGSREEDYQVSGVDYRTRGKRFDAMLDEWRRVWAGEPFGDGGPIGPRPAKGRPALMVGGTAPVSYARAARHADGWIMGGGTPDQLRDGVGKVTAAFEAAGRQEAPRIMALGYFALGPGAQEAANRYLHDYYAFLGDFAKSIAAGAATSADRVREHVEAFAEAGCDELIFFPSSPDPQQVDLLADALASR